MTEPSISNNPGTAPLIELNNITVERDHTRILDECSWQVNPLENWVIFGPNGAGKTTILNVLQGYLWPTSGTVRVFGGTLGDGVDVRAMREKMPVVSESVRRLINDGLTGLELIITGARGHLNIFSPLTKDEKAQARALAEKTNATRLLDKPFGVMSTGERQRILMTRALMPKPRVLVLDEPCSGLDLAGREWVLRTTQSIADLPWKPSLLLTTHHAEEIPSVFTHMLLISNGKVVSAGKIEQVFTSENLTRIFEMPLTVSRQNDRWQAQAR